MNSKDSLNGIICINKQQEMTSHDVCFRVRRILGTRQVGHSGTLDPMATGVMGILVGRSTKLNRFITDSRKEYIAGIRFGFESDSYDIWTDLKEYDTVDISEDELSEALQKLTGDIVQTPPIYSAIKVDGKPLYKYAREGKSVKIPERKVHIDSIEIIDKDLPNHLTVRVRCSKGTYIRSLVHDIGLMLNTHAVMDSLERTRSGSLVIGDAVTLEELETLRDEGRIDEAVKRDDLYLEDYKRIDVKPSSARFLLNGNKLYGKNIEGEITSIKEGETVRVYLDGKFIAMAVKTVEQEDHVIRPVRILYTGN